MSEKLSYDELAHKVEELEQASREKDLRLEESEKKFFYLFNSSFHEVHLWQLVRDEAGKIKTWSLVNANSVALKTWGKKLEEIKGKVTDEIFPNSNATESFMPIIEQIFSTGKALTWDTYFRDTEQHLYMVSTPFDDCFYSVGIDITDRVLREKIGEDRAKEKEFSLMQMKLVLESSGIAIWKYNLKENFLEWDDSMYQLYEIERKDFSGDYQAWETTLHPEDKERGDWEVSLAVKGDKDFDTVFRIITPKKEVKFIRAKAKILKDSEGKPEVMLGTNWDVTQDKKVQKILVEAKENAEKFAEQKSLFLAKMSHEIRTPMNGIIGMTSLLEKTEMNEEQKEMLSTVASCGESLLSIIDDVLDFSKIETGNLKLDMSNFDLHRCIEDVAKLFSAVATENHNQIRVEIGDGVPRSIHFDMVKLRQILSNLLSNAIKFSDAGAKVELGVKAVKAAGGKTDLCFSVKDHGIGMSQEEQDKVFQEFTQGDDSIARKYGGTGLGLSISSKIAEFLGGYLEVESVKGEGSTFIFVVEVEKGREVESEPEEREEGLLSERFPLRILIVEDNKVNQKVAIKTLAKMGYPCDLAEDGLQAIDKCRKNDYSLVLMDLQMPKLDGLTATQQILKEKPNLVIVAMTANVLNEDKARCTEAGMKGFLPKPFKLNDLREVITRLGKKT